MHQILCYFLSFVYLSQLSSIDANSDDYKVTIVHINDLYSAFSGVKHDNSLCDLNDDLNLCIGGAPKIVAQISEVRQKEMCIFFNAGNNLGGFWYKQFGPQVVSDFFKEFNFDVIAIGLSDFEFRHDPGHHRREGFENITRYLNAIQRSRVVSCNIHGDDRFISNFYQVVRKSQTAHQSGNRNKIGVIGFAKPPNLSPVNNSAFAYLSIKDPIKCLQEESESMRRDGFNIIIAVGSGDQELFQEILKNVPNVDLVVGSYGFTNDLSLLSERQSDSYPDFVLNAANGERIVVTADIFGKSVGKLSLTFDSSGNIKSSEGTLIKMDDQIKYSDEKTNKLMDNYQRALYIGETSMYLNGTDCSAQECNLGNLIADSLISYYLNVIKSVNSTLIKQNGNDVLKQLFEEPRDVIALINSKLIESSIGSVNNGYYMITKVSLDKVFGRKDPKIQVVILTGKTIRHLLEDYYQRSDLMQVSGLRVRYDSCQTNNNNAIIEISVKCSNCSDDSYIQLNDSHKYEVLLPQTIKINEYNDSLLVIKDLSAYDILDQYIRQKSPINATLQNRITFTTGKNDAFGAKTEILMTLFSTLIAVCHLRYYN